MAWRGLAVCLSPAPAPLTLSTTVHDGHKPPGLRPRGHVAHGGGVVPGGGSREEAAPGCWHLALRCGQLLPEEPGLA